MYFEVFLVLTHVSLVCVGQVIKPSAQDVINKNHQEEKITETPDLDELFIQEVQSILKEPTDNFQSSLQSRSPIPSNRRKPKIDHIIDEIFNDTGPPEKGVLARTLLRAYQGSINNYQVVPLNRLQNIASYLDPKKNWVFITFGFNESPESLGPREVISALLEMKKYNVILVDWSNYSNVGPIGRLKEATFNKAVDIGEIIGCSLGKGLVALNETLDIRSRVVALIGHDIGALIMAEVAGCAIINKIEMRLVWGLDPAGMLYGSLFGALPTLNYKLAEYVYTLHTDPHGFGSNIGMSTVDFWVNCKGADYFMQPGCSEGADKDSLRNQSLCNHQRAYYLFADGIRHPDSMPAVQARREADWRTGNTIKNSPLAYITIEPTPGARGQYFLRTRSQAPFGLYMVGVVAQRSLYNISTQQQTTFQPKHLLRSIVGKKNYKVR